MNALRRWTAADFEKGAGRHDDPDVYGGPPGDPGLIGPGSMSWEIKADLASVSQAGLPAIVLEILHPSVIAGVQDLSGNQWWIATHKEDVPPEEIARRAEAFMQQH